MRKTIKYVYLGTNGTICSPVHLEDVYYIRKVTLVADKGKRLTCDGIHFVYAATIPEEDVDKWFEVDDI